MSQSLAPQSSIRPLSIGNVVNAAVSLYRSHFKLYLGLSFRAFLWSLIPIYGWAKSNTISALISRITFSELINQPESVKTARSHVNPRMWDFLVTQILVGMISFAAYIGISILGFLLVSLPASMIVSLVRNNFGLRSIVLGTESLLRFVFFTGYLWIYSRIFLAELPLAIENKNDVDPVNTISRSWELTKGLVLRIQGIITVGFLVTTPIYGIPMIGVLCSLIFAIPLFARPIASRDTAQILGFIFIFIMTGLILFQVANAVLMPLWQIIKAVIYYDLRSRREGMGLHLRDRQASGGEESLS